MCVCTLHQYCWMSTSVKMKIFPRLRAKTGPGPATRRPTCERANQHYLMSNECSVLFIITYPRISFLVFVSFVVYFSLVVFTSLPSQFKYISSCRRSASSRTSKKSRWRKTGGPFDKMKSMSVLTKIDLFLLPQLLLAAFLSALDKVCIAVV